MEKKVIWFAKGVADLTASTKSDELWKQNSFAERSQIVREYVLKKRTHTQPNT